ncbi:hypothetical protein CVD25_20425 [Bacillus canaveralius]|uniref:YkyB-like protein n=1 Tax=Bacillus canaveralius TaxID=1403243 RepID=A0A2N5GJJ0_9BACI|nr:MULTISPECIES: YkyB family protein [Bacillus]PLR80532.1 hypothetical protein CVD23_20780 [Bacillus sp. V33-4]PLR81407.1 hypothetical protein CU635_15100 [Bacillus canaveralius]PLR90054.1 hypothetical protein CVD25_20425 [Bacillus canaveralius]RSK53069.1 hypothetical protein EJA13_09325 [Bacillus canaveralius]
MNRDLKPFPPLKATAENLSQAIFTVNRHAKTAPNPKYLYRLKKEAINKMIGEGKAKKVGLHFSRNPRNSQQQSDVLVVCGHYSFHIPPTKDDFKELPHLGSLNEAIRNPKAQIPLGQAKKLLQSYTGIIEDKRDPDNKRQYKKPVFKKLGESYL